MPSKAPVVKDCGASARASPTNFSSALTFHAVPASRAAGGKKAQALGRGAGNEGLCSCFSASVHCSDSGDKNVVCVSLRALACLQNASVLWSRHRPAGGGRGEGGGGTKGGAWGCAEGGLSVTWNSRSLGFQPPG